jgi:hypothetical protein
MSSGAGIPIPRPITAGDLLLRLVGAATVATGTLLVGQGTSQLATLPVATAGRILVAGASTPAWSDSGLSYAGGSLSVPNGTATAPGIRTSTRPHGLYHIDNSGVGISADGVSAGQFYKPVATSYGGALFLPNPAADQPSWLGGSATNSFMVIGGSSAAGINAGGQVRVYQNAHGTKPNFVEIGHGTLTGVTYDPSRAVVGSAGFSVTFGNGGAINSFVVVDAAAGQNRLHVIRTAGINRWSWGGGSTAETGSDAGTPFNLVAYNDAGTSIDTPLTIVRAAGGGLFLNRNTTLNFANAQLTIASGSGSSTLALNGQAAGNRDILFQSAGSLRWVIRADTTAESGSNAGSNLFIRAYTDAGALIDNAMSIVRAAGGTINMARPVSVTGVLTVGDGTSAVLQMSGAAGTARSIRFRSAGVDRWYIATSSASESGSNAGSALEIYAYTDAGALIDTPISIVRAAAGAMTVTRPTLVSYANAQFTVGNGTGAPRVLVDGGSGSERNYNIRTGGSTRWQFGGSNAAESGANAGTAFHITAYDDTATFIDVPVSIVRASGGTITLARPVSITNATASVSPATGAVTTAGGLGVAKEIYAGQLIASVIEDAGTASIVDCLYAIHNSTGTPGAGFGSRIRLSAESSTTASQPQAYLQSEWVVATHASRTARVSVFACDSAGNREVMRGEASGSAPLIGFLGAAAVARQTLGAAATDPATTQTLCNNLRTALINLGLGQT